MLAVDDLAVLFLTQISECAGSGPSPLANFQLGFQLQTRHAALRVRESHSPRQVRYRFNENVLLVAFGDLMLGPELSPSDTALVCIRPLYSASSQGLGLASGYPELTG